MLNGFDAEGAKGSFGDFANAGNFADGKRSEESRFHPGSDPDETARLALIGGDLGGEAGGGESARAG